MILDWILYVVIVVSIASALWTVTVWWVRNPDARYEIDDTMDLSQPAIRIRLQRMLDAYGITGSVNIREGQAIPCPNQEGKSDLSRLLYSGYVTGLSRTPNNPNIMLLVLRDGEMVPTGVTLDDLRTASIALED